MFQLEGAKLKDYYLLFKLLRKHQRKNFDFYSNFKGNIFTYFISKNIYKITKRNRVVGLIFVNSIKKEICFVPTINMSIELDMLINLLSNHDFTGYSFPFAYNGFCLLNLNGVNKNFIILKNYKLMVNNLENIELNINSINELSVENMKIAEQENIRVELQNKIFGNIINRKELTIDEVISEEKKKEFMPDLCFFLKYMNNYIGYGQIIKNQEGYFLINFGILQEYRNRGFGRYFLKGILIKVKNYGIGTIYLKVENNNYTAIRLYEDLGFEELVNVATIKIL